MLVPGAYHSVVDASSLRLPPMRRGLVVDYPLEGGSQSLPFIY